MCIIHERLFRWVAYQELAQYECSLLRIAKWYWAIKRRYGVERLVLLSPQQFQLFLDVRLADLGVAYSGPYRRRPFHGHMAQVVGEFL